MIFSYVYACIVYCHFFAQIYLNSPELHSAICHHKEHSAIWNIPLAKFISPIVTLRQAEPNYITPRRVIVSIHIKCPYKHEVRHHQASDIAKLRLEFLPVLEPIACIGCAVSKSNKSSVAEAMHTPARCRCHSADFC